MTRRHIIRETHTNLKNDWSDVILHDACTNEPVYRDGNDIVFPLEDGIIVRPHTSENDTDRYLQTDRAEVRLRNVTKITVRNGENFPCIGERFTILQHQYCTDKGIFRMGLTGGFGHDQLFYDFTCDSAEYSFGEFTGDSWIQQAKDHKRETMQRFLRQGRGEAVHMLRRMDDEGRREYLDIVTHAVTHDLRLDHQCNADRTRYIFDLLESYSGEDRERLNRAVLHGHWQEAAENDDIFALQQYLNVLRRFTESGESPAEETIRKMYECIRSAYETRTEIPQPYDPLGQKYEIISRFIGQPLPDDDGEHPVSHPRPAEAPLTMENIIENIRNSGENGFQPAKYRPFFRKQATPADVGLLAESAKNESDPLIKARLYSLFSETDCPVEPDELIETARSHEPMLHDGYGSSYITAFRLQRSLSRLRHPAVRAYGFELLERAMETKDVSLFVCAFDHWAANYDEQTDFDRFSELLACLPEWMDNRHSLEFTIVHEMFNRRYDDPRTYGHLVWVYENTYCSCCRRSAVEILAEHGRLQKFLREQCRFDCDPRTREIAEKAKEL